MLRSDSEDRQLDKTFVKWRIERDYEVQQCKRNLAKSLDVSVKQTRGRNTSVRVSQ